MSYPERFKVVKRLRDYAKAASAFKEEAKVIWLIKFCDDPYSDVRAYLQATSAGAMARAMGKQATVVTNVCPSCLCEAVSASSEPLSRYPSRTCCHFTLATNVIIKSKISMFLTLLRLNSSFVVSALSNCPSILTSSVGITRARTIIALSTLPTQYPRNDYLRGAPN
jgi:hypothetical protein